MNTKRLLCGMIAATVAAFLAAQEARSDLERVSLDFAERLISDGASVERPERVAQKQAARAQAGDTTTVVYRKKDRELDEKLQRMLQNLSDESKAHLDDYREMGALLQKASKIKKNRELIAEKATQFTPDEREDLYVANTVKNRSWFWNILPLPGFGLGSFGQGDASGGLMQLAGLGLAGIFLGKGINSHGSEQDFFMGAFCCTFLASPFIIGTIRPVVFKNSRNAMLRSSLNLNDDGRAVAQAAEERSVQLSFAPIVNPVTNQYGAVAQIRF